MRPICLSEPSVRVSVMTAQSLIPRTRQFVSSLLLLLLFVQKSASRTTYLFGAQPRGGILGVAVDSMRAGAASPLANNSLSSIQRQVASISYDHTSGHLVATQHRPDRLLYTPLCKDTDIEPITVSNASTTFPIVDAEVDHTMADCVSCHAGPFALFDNKIYFVLSGEFHVAPHSQQVVQLRVLQSCSDCALDLEKVTSLKIFKTPFLFNCSKVIAKIFEEPVNRYASLKVKTGQDLKVVKTEKGLQFFFQVFITRHKRNQRRSFAKLMLYRATDAGYVSALSTETVDRQYAQYLVNALASVDYKDGLLCWTVADRLYCGELDKQTWMLSQVQLLLHPGESVALQICTGEPLDRLRYVTGVAISEAANVWNERVLYFGCYAQLRSLGGAGMIKVRMDGGDKRVYPVQLPDGPPVRLGSMFVSEEPPRFCQPSAPLQVCLEPPEWVKRDQLQDKPREEQVEMEQEVIVGYKVEGEKEDDEGYRVVDEEQERADPEILVAEEAPREVQELEEEAASHGGAKSLYLRVSTIIMLLTSMLLA